MTFSAAKSAAIMTAILSAYFALAAVALNDGATTPAVEAASNVVGIFAGGLALLALMFGFTVFRQTIAADPPKADDEIDHWG